MNKAFTKEDDGEDDDLDPPDEALPAGTKNYMTRRGFDAMKTELHELLHVERPKIVEIVSWAAGNGDRSENGDYIYGKKRLREIDWRVRYLMKRIDSAEVVDWERQRHLKQIFFGATVTFANSDGTERTVTIVGVDEADLDKNRISWISPVARALMKAREGDLVDVRTPTGKETIEVLDICYGDGEAS